MRDLLLLAIGLVCLAASSYGQEEYRPLLTEGKTWVVVSPNMHPEMRNEDEVFYMTVCGDTIVEGQSCKIIVSTQYGESDENTRKLVVRENDRAIYLYDNKDGNDVGAKEFLPLIDFNIHKGDVSGWTVLSEDSVEVNGTSYRRLGLGSEQYGVYYYLVEGIGSSKDEWLTVFPTPPGHYSYLRECLVDGKRIFSEFDFTKGIPSGQTSKLSGKWLWTGGVMTLCENWAAETRCCPVEIRPTNNRNEVLIVSSNPAYRPSSLICCAESYAYQHHKWPGNVIKATVYEEEGTLTIRSGQVVDTTGEPIFLYAAERYDGTNDNGNERPDKYTRLLDEGIKGKLQSDGSIVFPREQYIGFDSMVPGTSNEMLHNGSYSAGNEFVPVILEEEPRLEEYEYRGEAVFTDCWFNARLRQIGMEEIKEVKVPLWCSEDENILLLQNPYADSRWKDLGLQQGDGQGYIMLDISDPKFVKVVPKLRCGMKALANEDGEPTDFFPLTGSQWDELNGLHGRMPYNTDSYLDKDIVYIHNPIFGTDEAPFFCNFWNGIDNASEENTGMIRLPQGWSGTSQFHIDSNSTPQYLNLQGVWLTEPQKGVPVIEVKDGKARIVIL